MLDSLSRSQKIKLILTRHEQGAGFMAATYGRHTGKTGVCMATLGPGATNFVTAAAYAQLGGMPILMVTGQKPIKKSKQGRFQILDVVDMMRPITKFTHQLASADNIPSRIREAIRLAEEEKPGATHIEFPEDIADEHTDSLPLTPSLHRRPNADEKAIRAAVKRIEQAKAPVLVLGAGANRKMTSRMLLQFIEKTGHSLRHHPARQGRARRDAPPCSLGARRCPRATSCTGRSRRRTLSSTSAMTLSKSRLSS
jgi:acetolactate synthase-1/2/3 large subunit